MFQVCRIEPGGFEGLSRHRVMRVAKKRQIVWSRRADLPTRTVGFRIFNLKTNKWVGPLVGVR